MQKLVLAALILITVAVIVFLAAMAWISAAPVEGPKPPLVAQDPQGLLIPVEGVPASRLSDTFAEARGRGRPHDAIDIMAPRGTLVVAAADGIVEKLFFSRGGGGITAYLRSPDRRWIHYYAHLDGYAPGLAEGRRLARGDPIGTVGSTGNADPRAPHLHFAVHLMGPNERRGRGRPVNPYPLLAGR